MSEPLGGIITVTGQQIGYTLTKDIISSYSCTIADAKTVSDILTELLAYQEIERVVLGDVSPSLDKVIALDLKKGINIWEACKTVRDTVGGFIYVDFDPETPATRRLNLVDDIGESKGQQIRLGKNLTGIYHSTDFIELANRLYPVGSGDLLLSSKSYTRADVTPSSDASYGYLNLLGLYSAYKEWTGLGDALPSHIKIEAPTGAFVSPTGYEDSAGWVYPQYAYDANDATYARRYNWYPRTWTAFLILSHAGVTASSVKWYNPNVYIYIGDDEGGGDFFPGVAIVDIDVRVSGIWQHVFYGEAPVGWVISSFDEAEITGLRFRAFNPTYQWSGPLPSCNEKDIYIWDSDGWSDDTANWVQGADENTLRCAIGTYQANIGYVVSYTHAPYLIALDEITDRDEISSRSESFETSDIDALIELGRTRLAELMTPVISINIGAIDLSAEEGREFEELALGDTVTVIDEGLDISESARVVRLSKPDLFHPDQIVIDISNKIKDIIDVI